MYFWKVLSKLYIGVIMNSFQEQFYVWLVFWLEISPTDCFIARCDLFKTWIYITQNEWDNYNYKDLTFHLTQNKNVIIEELSLEG